MRKFLSGFAIAILLVGCDLLFGPKETEAVTQDPIPSGFARLKGKLQMAAGAAEAVSGTEVYILGQRQFKTAVDASGNYTILVDTNKSQVVASSSRSGRAGIGDLNSLKYQMLAISTSGNYGTKVDDVSVTANTESVLPNITTTKTGHISGTVVLEDGRDPTGIDVYIPGTSFIAKTDGSGGFIISDVPEGTYSYLRAEISGYSPKYWTRVKVTSDTETQLTINTLAVNTGVQGGVVIADGAAMSRNRTVSVRISYSSDALLMKVSEDSAFTNVPWDYLKDAITYTFNTDGQKTLYVQFADSNGLETSPLSDDILIIADPVPVLQSPAETVSTASPIFRWQPSGLPVQTYQFQLASDASFTSILEQMTGLLSPSYTLAMKLADQNAYYWRVRVIDQDGGFGSWVSDDFIVDLLVPTILTPSPGANLSETKPQLTWSTPVANTEFALEISTSSNFSQIVESVGGLDATTYSPNALASGRIYYWRVAIVSAGTIKGRWSSAYFSVFLPAPATSIIDTQKTRKPLFSWESSALAASYRLQVSTDATFAINAIDILNIAANYYIPDSLLRGGAKYYWRVAYSDNNGIQGAWSEVKSFSIDHYLIDLVSPAGNPGSSKPLFSWTDSYLEGEHYQFQMSTDSTFTTTLINDSEIGTTSYRIDIPLENQKSYYWRVKAIAADGDEGPWASPWIIKLDYLSVVLNSPTHETVIQNRNPTFLWEPQASALTYRVQIARNSSFPEPVVDIASILGTQITCPSSLQGSSVYYWRVSYMDANGVYGAWSETRRFSVEPYSVSLISPSGNPGVSKPLFAWTDSYLSGERYRFQLSADSTFGTFLIDIAEIGTTSYRIAVPIETQKPYYWRVKAIASDGDEGPWTAPWGINLDYAAVALDYPNHNSTIADRTPEFRWATQSLASTYQLQIAEDILFSALVVDKAEIGETICACPVNLNGNRKYYWRLRYVDESDIRSPWSEVRQFTVEPYTVSLVSPNGNPGSSKPLFTWTDTYLIGELYRFQLSADSTFATTLVDNAEIGTTSYRIAVTIENQKPYYWRVKAIASDGDEGPWTTPWEIALNYPAVILNAPEHDAAIGSRTPEFRWAPGGAAVAYRVQIASDVLFTNPVLDKNNVGTTIYTSSALLSGGNAYYWRVSYMDANGVYGAWSETRRFSVDPYTISLISPTGNPGVSKPLFAWTDSYLSGERYRFQLSADSTFGTTLVDNTEIGTTSYRIAATIENQKSYYWRVKAIASDGDEGPWTTPWGINLDYAAVSLDYPYHNSAIATRTPEFRWAPEGMAVAYRIQIASDVVFTSPVLDKSNIGTTIYTSTTLLSGGNAYYWRVSYVDSNGVYGPWSETRRFSVEPYTVSPVSPKGNPMDSMPTYAWTDSYLANEKHDFQITRNPYFETTDSEITTIIGTSCRPTFILQNRTAYYWRVRAIAADGDIGPWSDACPIYLDYPTTYYTDPWNGQTIYSATPTVSYAGLVWAANYRIEFTDLSNFSSVLASGQSAGLQYQVQTVLPDNRYIYWRVAGIDANGIQGPWSDLSSFYLPPHSLSVNLSITLPNTTQTAYFANAGSFSMPWGSYVDISVGNYWDFSYFEWSVDGVPISGATDSSYRITGLAKGKYNISLIAYRNGIPYDVHAWLEVY